MKKTQNSHKTVFKMTLACVFERKRESRWYLPVTSLNMASFLSQTTPPPQMSFNNSASMKLPANQHSPKGWRDSQRSRKRWECEPNPTSGTLIHARACVWKVAEQEKQLWEKDLSCANTNQTRNCREQIRV